MVRKDLLVRLAFGWRSIWNEEDRYIDRHGTHNVDRGTTRAWGKRLRGVCEEQKMVLKVWRTVSEENATWCLSSWAGRYFIFLWIAISTDVFPSAFQYSSGCARRKRIEWPSVAFATSYLFLVLWQLYPAFPLQNYLIHWRAHVFRWGFTPHWQVECLTYVSTNEYISFPWSLDHVVW